MPGFSEEQKNELRAEIENNDLNNAQETARYNQAWDISFNVVVLLVSLGIVICSAVATSKISTSPYWSLASAILGGVSTAISGFAFSKFNFAHRQQIWQKKADTFSNLIQQLCFLDPDRNQFLRQLAAVRGWNDATPLDAGLPD